MMGTTWRRSRLPSSSTLVVVVAIVVVVVVVTIVVVVVAIALRADIDPAFSLLALDAVVASHHIGDSGCCLVALGWTVAGGTGVVAVGGQAMGPAVVHARDSLCSKGSTKLVPADGGTKGLCTCQPIWPFCSGLI